LALCDEWTVGSDRQSDKDALDVLRLLRGTETTDLATRFGKLLADARSLEVATSALRMLEEQFAKKNGIGTEMAVRSTALLADPAEIAAPCEALASDLLLALAR